MVISSSIPDIASLLSLQISTPFPSARPSALSTIGYLTFSRYFMASFGSLKFSYPAVGISYFFIRSFEKAFEPSSMTAFFLGPNTLSPSASKQSTIPFTSGSSIPIIVKSIFSFFAKSVRALKSITDIATFVAISSVPALPGAT